MPNRMRFFVMRLFHFVMRTPRFCELCNLPKAGKKYHIAAGYVCKEHFKDCQNLEDRWGLAK